MKNRIKWSLCFMIVLSLVFPSFAYSNDHLNQGEIKRTVEEFYKTSYDIYLSMEMKDMDSLLDMTTVQSQNYMTALERNTTTWKYSLDKGYTKVIRDRYPIYFDFKSIVIGENEATAIVYISGQHTEALEAYPPFVVFGENVFKFNSGTDGWLIAEHDYEGYLFEDSKTHKIEFSKEELFKRIDYENKGLNATNNSDMETPSQEALYPVYSTNGTRVLGYSNRPTLIISAS